VPLEITLFTDPACPFAFSAEPARWRLRWHYGDGLAWTTRMIVLTREEGEAEKLAQGAPTLQRRHGMPIDPRPYERPASSEPACRAFVAVRERDPAAAERFLRALRIRVMQHGLLDDPELIAAAAADAGVDDWSGGEEALEADAAAARAPSPAACALRHKLGKDGRYTAPSYLIGDLAVPGFNPVEVYEAAIANAAPDLPRRDRPASVAELLEWAGEPLATAEVVMMMAASEPAVRAELARVARFQAAGADGYWTLA
jgi:predicted DsbA family dithiol-disulfide isomerase